MVLMGLETYHQKRDFTRTPEPKGKLSKAGKQRFVCQEHHASSLHFDFRLEIGGVLKSWSLRKGPSMDPKVRRLAVPTEDHPVEYLKFQGDIPEGNYGAGQHRIWDEGTYKLSEGGDPEKQLEKGKLKLELNGGKMNGTFNLFRLGGRDQWLLVKSNDEHAEEGWKLELLLPDENGNKFIEEKPDGNGSARRRTSAKRSRSDRPVVKQDAKPKEGEKLPSVFTVLLAKNPTGDKRVKAGKYALDLTSLDRVYWPEDGFTKADLLRYYYKVAKHILPYLENRPLIMKRYPTGVGGASFHQHDVDEVPEFVRTIALDAEGADGTHKVDYIVGGNVQTHLYLANLGAIERHPWHSRVDNIGCPDWFIFDMDPGDAVEFGTICDLALVAKEVLADHGLESYAKTSGSRGIHVHVPVKPAYSFEQVADLAARIAKSIAKEGPGTATVERSKSNRNKDQIYVDHMQNAYGKSVVAPYSVRPRPGATVSAPVAWEEVGRKMLSTEDFNIKNMPDRLEKKGDLFEPVLTNKQDLEAAFEKAKLAVKGKK